VTAGPLRPRYERGYPEGVKTAVSLPDDLFERAKSAARRLRVSRSALFATAIREFLDREQSDQITERLNRIYARRRAKLDPALHRAQIASLPKENW
jgi:metal-responsive CopG/Arc/MetJ family transcriptional regulator